MHKPHDLLPETPATNLAPATTQPGEQARPHRPKKRLNTKTRAIYLQRCAYRRRFSPILFFSRKALAIDIHHSN
jgi:hypothetical protein